MKGNGITYGGWEWGAEENIWIQGTEGYSRLKETSDQKLHNVCSSPSINMIITS
jgi:hypothetical protein